jgi:TPR repeat protein
MKIQGRFWGLAGAVAIATGIPAATSFAQQSVEEGFKAWDAGRHEEAVRFWRVLADRGDGDAQFALGHAYRLGRGVPQNLNLAEQWYERAARNGHQEAQAMYGVILFQNGRRREALPYIERGAANGDPRAQYVLGTVLFNGDYLPADHPRAYALMTRAAAQGLPQAESHLREMNQHISAEDRARGSQLARAMLNQPPARMAEASTMPSATGRPRAGSAPAASAAVQPPARSQPITPAPAARPRPVNPPVTQPGAAQAPVPATGRWRIQLGAFSSEANARRAWTSVSGRLSGLQPYYIRAGALTRLQAGPLADRAAAERSCASVRSHGGACLVVAP